ncbi:hypothetical protein Gogos_004531 [Gossypium gossypioides]|uniref:RNase H type-1 domain-containing protein n=1 Tax=Gossypium gossypioides TaxID=34282 RepID=A0A7J9CGP9_GOSGO|nr:hypothetical protein [Gossypium gossypioides]
MSKVWLVSRISHHAILKCGPANEVWSQLGLYWVTDPYCDSLRDWIAYSFQSNDATGCSKILIMMWLLGHARNQFVMEDINVVKWLPPERAVVKINFDAAFKQNLHQSCSGFVIRYNLGLVMGNGSILNSNVADAFSVEALPCLQALTFVKEMGFSQVVVEGDSRMTIIKARRGVTDRTLGNSQFWVEEVPHKSAEMVDKDRRSLQLPEGT